MWVNFCRNSGYNHWSCLHFKINLLHISALYCLWHKRVWECWFCSQSARVKAEQFLHSPRWFIRTPLIGHCVHKLNRNMCDWLKRSALQTVSKKEIWCNVSRSTVNVMLQSTLLIHFTFIFACMIRQFDSLLLDELFLILLELFSAHSFRRRCLFSVRVLLSFIASSCHVLQFVPHHVLQEERHLLWF